MFGFTMKVSELKSQTEELYNGIRDYRKLLSVSRDHYMPDIVRNHEEISSMQTMLTRRYAKLAKYVIRFGKNPQINDGVWNVTYSPYDNAFSKDILLRIGPSTDAVISDLDFIIGTLEGMDPDESLEEKRQSPQMSAKEDVKVEKSLEELSEQELLAILRMAENTDVPGSRYQRAKIELEIRDREKPIPPSVTYHVGRDVINTRKIDTEHNSTVQIGGGGPSPRKNRTPWYRRWYMICIVYPLLIAILAVCVDHYYFTNPSTSPIVP